MIYREECVLKKVSGLVLAVLMFGMASSVHASVVDLYSVADAEITGRFTGSSVNTHNWGGLNWLTGNVIPRPLLIETN
jgi:hypothetical protein